MRTQWCDNRGKVCVFNKCFSFCSRVVIVWNFAPLYSSNIVHPEAGLGLFAARDFMKGEVIGHYFGALYLCHKSGFHQFKNWHLLAIQTKKILLKHPFGSKTAQPVTLMKYVKIQHLTPAIRVSCTRWLSMHQIFKQFLSVTSTAISRRSLTPVTLRLKLAGEIWIRL